MSLGIRKMTVVALVGGVFLMANALLVAHWLDKAGVIGWANTIRKDFLTGTAITVIVALLILMVPPRQAGTGSRWFGRCPVCDHMLVGNGKYCGECGSKIC